MSVFTIGTSVPVSAFIIHEKNKKSRGFVKKIEQLFIFLFCFRGGIKNPRLMWKNKAFTVLRRAALRHIRKKLPLVIYCEVL